MPKTILMMDLLRALYWFDEALQARLEQSGYSGLNRTQSMLLANIAVGEHRAIRLARNLGISRQAISQILAELEARHIIAVHADPYDKRARIVDFHEDARELRKVASAILSDLETQVSKRLGERRFSAMRAALATEWGDANPV